MATRTINYLVFFVLGWTIVYFIILYKQFYSPDDPIFNSHPRRDAVATSGQNVREKAFFWPHNEYILSFGHFPHCFPLNPDILLYNRIYKTGSTTTKYLLDTFSETLNFSLEFATTEDSYDSGKSRVYPGIIARHANRKLSRQHIKHFVFVAHFYFRYRLNVSFTYTYINQVRDPVKRVISHYFYIRRDKTRPRQRLQELKKSGHLNESFEDCLRLQHTGCESNLMTRFFCGKHSYCNNGGDKALRKAKRNIHRHYAAIGLLEHFEIYIQILHKRLPAFVPTLADSMYRGKSKVNPLYNISEVSNDTIEYIKKLNTADLKLYDFIKERFWSQAKACNII